MYIVNASDMDDIEAAIGAIGHTQTNDMSFFRTAVWSQWRLAVMRFLDSKGPPPKPIVHMGPAIVLVRAVHEDCGIIEVDVVSDI